MKTCYNLDYQKFLIIMIFYSVCLSPLIEILSKNGLPYNLVYKDELDSFLGRQFLIDESLATFNIGRFHSMKGSLYDNAVGEATFKIIKLHLWIQMNFHSLKHLALELSDYVNLYNKHRIHGTLGYVSPMKYKKLSLQKVV